MNNVKRDPSRKGRYAFLHLTDSKAPIYICVLLSLLCNVTLATKYFLGNYEASYGVYSVVSALIDLIFLILFHFSNMRFRYAFIEAVAYALISLLAASVPIALYNPFAKTNIFTTSMSILTILTHFAAALLVVIIARLSGKYEDKGAQNASYACASLSLVSLGVLLYFTFSAGYFGQGNGRNLILNRLDDGSYEVVGIIKGPGASVEVKDYGGKKISAIDASIFASDDVSSIRFDKHLEIKNPEKLDNANPHLVVEGEYEVISAYREDFFKEAAISPSPKGALSLANNVGYLDAERSFVHFAYDEEAFSTLYKSNNLLLDLVGEKGEAMQQMQGYVDDFEKNPYGKDFLLSDSSIVDSYLSNKKKVLYSDSDLISYLDGKKQLSENEGTLSFDLSLKDVYLVSFEESNDSLYPLERGLAKNEAALSKGRYVLEISHGSGFPYEDYARFDMGALLSEFDGYASREGFDFAFVSNGKSITSLTPSSFVDNKISLKPTWSIRSPSFDLYDKEKNFRYTYGEQGHFEAVIGKENVYDDVFDYELSWYLNDEESHSLSDAEKYVSRVLLPSDSKISVFLRISSSKSSLTAVIPVSKTLYVAKKTLGVEAFLESNVYTSYDIKMNVSLFGGVGDDDLSCFSLTVTNLDKSSSSTFDNPMEASVKNAGTYSLAITLSRELSKLYVVDARVSSSRYVISRYELKDAWEGAESSFTYNGQKHSPVANIVPLKGDSLSDVFDPSNGYRYTQNGASVPSPIHGGEYCASLVFKNDNYFASPFFFSILKKKVFVNYEPTDSFVYNGEKQSPKVASIDGFLPGEEANIAFSGTSYIDVGSYKIVASLASSDYELDKDSGVMDFSITPLHLDIKVNDASSTYGEIASPLSFAYIGSSKLLDRDGDCIKLYVDGASFPLAEAGEYEILARCLSSNYDISDYHAGAYTIRKREVEAKEDDNVYFTYDGTDQSSSLSEKFYFIDQLGQRHPLSASVEKEFKDAGNYAYTLSLKDSDAKNYLLTGNLTGYVNMRKKTLPVSSSSKSFTYNGLDQSSALDEYYFVFINGTKIYLEATPIESFVNAGDYQIKLALPLEFSANYSPSISFARVSISKAGIAITWEDVTLTYNGLDQSSSINGKASFRDVFGNKQLVNVTVDADVVDASSYVFSALLSEEQAQNYVISSQKTHAYVINPMNVDVFWNEKEFYYTGEVLKISSPFYVDAFGKRQYLSVSFDKPFKEVGTYVAKASFASAKEAQNYRLNNPTHEYKILEERQEEIAAPKAIKPSSKQEEEQ